MSFNIIHGHQSSSSSYEINTELLFLMNGMDLVFSYQNNYENPKMIFDSLDVTLKVFPGT